ncbi:hypothetical protein D3C75_1086720 [compost metagenome]
MSLGSHELSAYTINRQQKNASHSMKVFTLRPSWNSCAIDTLVPLATLWVNWSLAPG